MELEVNALADKLPKRVVRLSELAYNVWWTWHREAQVLFENIDHALWEQVYHNPVKFLYQVSDEALQSAIQNKHWMQTFQSVLKDYDDYMRSALNPAKPQPARKGSKADTWFAKTYGAWRGPVAYMSFEFGLHEILPMYAGGLGVLAADHLKEASDLGLPAAGIGFLYLQGYFKQRITEDGWQEADYENLDFSQLPVTLVRNEDGSPLIVSFDMPTMKINLQIWKVQVGRLPLYLLDTAGAEGNNTYVKSLTQRLYNSDPDMRISQEIVLGIGGVRVLRALGINPSVWHMNEGHPAFSTLERIRELVKTGMNYDRARDQVRKTTVFTTHTPVPAGNDRFAMWQIDRQLNGFWNELGLTRERFMAIATDSDGLYGMTVLALRMAQRSNGVSKLHGEVAGEMWSWMGDSISPIGYITNGVHTGTWIARRVSHLYDTYLGKDWMNNLDDLTLWKNVRNIPDAELWDVRRHYKRTLAGFLRERARVTWTTHTRHPVQTIASGVLLDPYALTIGFARRFPTYKRATLILSQLDRLIRIINNADRPVQILFAGKSHPNDEPGKQLIQKLYRAVKNADSAGRLVFIEDYDMNVARHLVWGVDVWMNTPRRPYEASGTSGMKAALNGALNFSVLDGWWPEAYNGKNGWAIGTEQEYASTDEQDAADANSLFDTLENEIVPLYYDMNADDVPVKWLKRVKESLATCAPMFSTRRMVKQYINEMYAPLAK
jgi:starch phosphorylase